MSEVLQVLKIPIDFYDDFKQNPEDSLRDIAGIPSIQLRPLFDDPEKVNDCIDVKKINPLDEKIVTIAHWLNPIEYKEYYIHLDGSQGGDGYGIAMCHLLFYKGEPRLPYIEVDFMGIPNKKTYGKDFTNALIEELLSDLIRRGFNIKVITYDRATDISAIIASLAPSGVIIEPMSIDRCTTYPLIDLSQKEPPYCRRESTNGYPDKPMTEFASIINRRGLIVPFHPYWKHLPYTFEHDRAKKQVKKMGSHNDDLGQAVGGAVFNCLNNAKDLETEQKRYDEAIKEWRDEYKPDSFERNLNSIQQSSKEISDIGREQSDKEFYSDEPPDEEIDYGYSYDNFHNYF